MGPQLDGRDERDVSKHLALCVHIYIYMCFKRWNQVSTGTGAVVRAGRSWWSQPFSLWLARTQPNSRCCSRGDAGVLHSLLHQWSYRKLVCGTCSIPAASPQHPRCRGQRGWEAGARALGLAARAGVAGAACFRGPGRAPVPGCGARRAMSSRGGLPWEPNLVTAR